MSAIRIYDQNDQSTSHLCFNCKPIHNVCFNLLRLSIITSTTSYLVAVISHWDLDLRLRTTTLHFVVDATPSLQTITSHYSTVRIIVTMIEAAHFFVASKVCVRSHSYQCSYSSSKSIQTDQARLYRIRQLLPLSDRSHGKISERLTKLIEFWPTVPR
jgi:hypothetical protein